MGYGQIMQQNWMIWLAIAIWVLPWKGVALWKAARLKHTKWFVAILILNTLALLDIFYIFVIARKAEKSASENN